MSIRLLLLANLAILNAQVTVPHQPVGSAPPLPPGKPHPPPTYMQDNILNFFGTAPDQGSPHNGPVLGNQNAVAHNTSSTNATASNGTTHHHPNHSTNIDAASASDSYWLASLGPDGQMPLAPDGYQLFRNVKDFGAVGDGETDDTAAINRAVATYGLNNLDKLRCGADCGSTTTLEAVVYFPEGTYLISSPIVQYYYTQFVGNPNSKPVIQGSLNFTGIALVDNDVYVVGGNGSEWYINQSNFYRQIRNLVFDMTKMNWTNTEGGQEYVPAGVHWQVGQATSITNCDFKMAVSDSSHAATAVGIYMENGSGGFVSDLTFFGGNIGFLAGSQQFTAANLEFTSCLTAIKHVWNWGFNWKNIYVVSCYIALDCTAYSGYGDQGTGSISVVDSHFNGVPYAITVADKGDEQPNIVLDNLLVENSASIVLVSGGDTILQGSTDAVYINSWASGYQFSESGVGGKKSGYADPAPNKPAALLDSNGAYFRQPKPQYPTDSPIAATSHGVSNDGTGDQTSAINSLLTNNVGSIIFFPAGIYLVEGTVHIPVGSRIVGSAWSQIMGTGSFFEDKSKPAVMVQVGDIGDSGLIEISDMLFTVKGPTAGAILVEWNVHESSQGSAAMWDSHFRVGGAAGTDLQLSDCPASGTSVSSKCMAASLLLHVTSQASIYLENVWAWTADHDLDNKLNGQATESNTGIPLNVQTDVSVYSARGILIESQGPSWLYGTASEHAQLYQYQLFNASTIYLGHMQTETPYYQPKPNALQPYTPGQFPGDPTFENCADDLCRGAWALRMVNSSDIFIYSAGFYSFFQDYQLGCTNSEDCQLALVDTNFVSSLWLYNLFTKGNIQIISPEGGLPALLFNSTTSDGYTSEIAAWLALAESDGSIGSSSGSGSGFVTLDPAIYSSPTAQCFPPCTFVLPPVTLSSETTLRYPPLTTSLEVGTLYTTTITYTGEVTTTTLWESAVATTVISLPAITTSVISAFQVTVTDNSTTFYPVPSVVPPPFNLTDPTVVSGTTFPPGYRTYYPPPWPGSSYSYPSSPKSPTSTSSSSTTTTVLYPFFPTITQTRGPPKPTCTQAGKCGHSCHDELSDGGLCYDHPCYLNCGGGKGPPGIDWWAPDDPNKPPGPPPGPPGSGSDSGSGSNPSNSMSSSSQCETATYSSCSTQCVTGSPSTTSSCSSTCRNIVGCDTTGTQISSIYTLPPLYPPQTIENWYDYNQSYGITTEWTWGQAIFTSIESEVDSQLGTTPPPTTATPTTTPYISCSTQEEDPDQGLPAYCICDGVTAPITSVGGVQCAYTAVPTATTSVSTDIYTETLTNVCDVCVFHGRVASCTNIPGCTPSSITATPTVVTTTYTDICSVCTMGNSNPTCTSLSGCTVSTTTAPSTSTSSVSSDCPGGSEPACQERMQSACTATCASGYLEDSLECLNNCLNESEAVCGKICG